jgi:L-threonylcarbamoyladenylate synthase
VFSTAAEILKTGELVAFPTDTVYGVGGIAYYGKAIKKIYRVKKRHTDKAIPILIGSMDDLGRVARYVDPRMQMLIDRYWPGPLTIIVQKGRELPDEISMYPTVGVRMPDHPFTRELLCTVGPLAATSANISGRPDPLSAKEVTAQIGDRIPLIIDGGQTPGGHPSTVVELRDDELLLLRSGPIAYDELLDTVSN